MSLAEYVLLFASVIAGGALGLHLPGLHHRHVHLVLTVSGAYLLSVTALHLLPEAFGVGGVQPGWALLLGFFLQIVFEQMSGGVEHGHIHAHEGDKLALPVLVGLSFHALLEGSPLTLDHAALHHGHDHNHLLLGIALHKLPAGFALSVLLARAGYRRAITWALLLVFASMSPAGALLSEALMDPRWTPYLLALVSGSLLHVGTTILFEADGTHHHRVSWRKLAAVAAGIGAGLLTSYI